MAITDVDGKMRRINRPWLDLFGYLPEDCIGQGLFMVLQPGATPSSDWMRACVLRPQRLEVVGRRKDGGLVLVRLENADKGWRVQIDDDGSGFVPAGNGSAPGHLGLTTMRERAQIAGGWWKLESQPGAGTSVAFWLPAIPEPTLTSPQATRARLTAGRKTSM